MKKARKRRRALFWLLAAWLTISPFGFFLALIWIGVPRFLWWLASYPEDGA
jgi:hypothetical protein